MLQFKIALSVKIVLINLVFNAKLIKLFKEMDVQFHGDHVIMLIILIVLINGQVKKKLNVLFVKIFGQLSKQQDNDLIIKILF